jgi:hypothetical protein
MVVPLFTEQRAEFVVQRSLSLLYLPDNFSHFAFIKPNAAAGGAIVNDHTMLDNFSQLTVTPRTFHTQPSLEVLLKCNSVFTAYFLPVQENVSLRGDFCRRAFSGVEVRTRTFAKIMDFCHFFDYNMT